MQSALSISREVAKPAASHQETFVRFKFDSGSSCDLDARSGGLTRISNLLVSLALADSLSSQRIAGAASLLRVLDTYIALLVK